jgi:uncharacterized membrane protein YhaH (DUF805 family)
MAAMSFSAWISGRGRISRAAWWKYYGAAAFACVALIGLAQASLAWSPPAPELAALAAAGALLLLPPAVAGSSKRWHDQDHSGWWQLVMLVPVLGGLWNLFVTGALRGTVGPNRFGPDPLETGGTAPAWGRPGGVPRGTRTAPSRPALRTDS